MVFGYTQKEATKVILLIFTCIAPFSGHDDSTVRNYGRTVAGPGIIRFRQFNPFELNGDSDVENKNIRLKMFPLIK